MGLLNIFTSRSAGQAAGVLSWDGWAPDRTGIAAAGDNVDQDQVSESMSIRLRWAGAPGAVIDLIFYVVATEGAEDFDRDQGVCTVGLTVEWIICADPDQAATTATWRTSAEWDLPGPLDFHYAWWWLTRTAETLNTGQWDVAGVCAAFTPDSNGEQLAELMLGWDGEPFELEEPED